MRQNVRQERPWPPQERAVKSPMRDIPPAPLRPVAPRRDRKALGIRSWHNSYSILSYAIFFYIVHLILSKGISFSTQTPPKASTTPHGEQSVFRIPPIEIIQNQTKINQN